MFPRVTGKEHQHEFGLALAAERLVSIDTGRRWLNRPGKSGDVEGLNVRWTHHVHGGLGIRKADVDDGDPWVLVTGNALEELVVRGWAYYAEVCLPEHWRTDWQYPAWCRPQRILRPLSTIPPLEEKPVIDLPFEALVEVTGATIASERGALNAALKQIREASDQLDDEELASEIRYRAKTYKEMWPGITLTPSALSKHWERVPIQAPKPTYAEPKPITCSTCNGDKIVFVGTRPAPNAVDSKDTGFDLVAPCPDCNRADVSFWRHDGTKFMGPDPGQVRGMLRS